MSKSIYVRFSITFLLVCSMLSPAAALAMGDGKKHFKAGMKHEVAEAWDRAAEEFALAVTENPKNPEYRLHLQRALFQASQQYIKKGTAAANEKDYEGGYNAFRKAYAYDPTNELARAEMERMVRLQQGLKDGTLEEQKDANGKVKLVQTGYNPRQQDAVIPQKLEKLRDIPFPGGVNLQFIVKELAKDLDLNVLFDTESRLDNRTVKIELRQVSAAKALDYIFLQENLFFQKVGPRTILVASGQRRPNFQQLILRTFYLANANPKDVKTVIQTAIPAQPGRSQTIVLEDPSTNSITVRDTEENVRLIGKLIASLDKDRAEVVMDVAIYEVNKTDLLQLGNQIGTADQLTNLGGTTRGVLGGNRGKEIFGTLGKDLLPTVFGVGWAIPAANLMAFQSKGNTKLIASTQIHAFNNEDSSARIGQRVPVQTAQIVSGVNNNTSGSNGFVSNVINYEQVGLTLKFKPIVFPNQDVQVAMEIESKDVGISSDPLIPIFTERTIKGTARVQNNKTLLLASVAQNTESNGRSGLPLLGLIPILGRLFTAPRKDNRQVDIVIAITPKVIRAPSILPEDEIERPTGSIATPTNSSLEAMIIQDEKDEQLALARRIPNTTQVQLPDQQTEAAPAYVRDSSATSGTAVAQAPPQTPATDTATSNLKPIDSGVKTLQIKQTSDTSMSDTAKPLVENMAPIVSPISGLPSARLTLPAELPTLKVGERTKIAVSVTGSTTFRSAVLGVNFDEKKLVVRSVQYGDIFGTKLVGSAASPFLNQNGKMFVSLSMPGGAVETGNGVLVYLEVEALADGKPELTFEKDVMNFLTAEGRNFNVSF